MTDSSILEFIRRLDEVIRFGSARVFENISASGPVVALRAGLYPVGLALFLFPLLCILLGAGGFLLGLPLTKWHMLAALPLMSPVLYFSCGRKRAMALACFCAFLLANALLLALFSLPFYDEGDGIAYHKPAAILMADGWNPVRDPENTRRFDGDLRPANDNDGYVRSAVWWYPKAQWIFVAETYLLTGNVDAGSYANGIDMILSFALAWWGLAVLFRLSGFERFLASFVITMNTVVVVESTSGMIDTQIGSLLTILLFSLAGYAKTRDVRFLPFIAGSIPLVCNIKSTGFVYAGIAVLLFVVPLAWMARRNGGRQDRPLLAVIGASLLVTLVIGVNPYLTNTLNHANPLHPFTAGGAYDPIRAVYIDPPDSIFHGSNGLQRFVVSHLIAQPRTICGTPFNAFEIIPAQLFFGGYGYDLVHAEVCAFGPLFSIGLGASLVLLFFVGHRDAWWLLIAVAATVLAQPHPFIGRYVPQLWLVPPLVLCAIRSQSRPTVLHGIRSALLFYAILGLLATGCTLVIGGHWRNVRTRTRGDIYAVRLIEHNPRLLVGRASDLIGTWFYQERVVRDCLAAPRISEKDPRKQHYGAILVALRFAPVVLETDPKSARRELGKLIHPPPAGLLGNIAELRLRQIKRAWGGGMARLKPGKV